MSVDTHAWSQLSWLQSWWQRMDFLSSRRTTKGTKLYALLWNELLLLFAINVKHFYRWAIIFPTNLFRAWILWMHIVSHILKLRLMQCKVVAFSYPCLLHLCTIAIAAKYISLLCSGLQNSDSNLISTMLETWTLKCKFGYGTSFKSEQFYMCINWPDFRPIVH